MKRKAFTLIELLAVLVILAIIILIAIPLVSDVISSAKKNSVKITAEMLVKTAKGECVAGELTSPPISKNVVFNNGAMGAQKINFSGETPETGEINITSSCQVELVIHDGKYCARKEYGEEIVKIGEGSYTDCSNDVIGWDNYTIGTVKTYAKVFGGSQREMFHGADKSASGHVVAVGYSISNDKDLVGLSNGVWDSIIVKYDENGSVLWKDNYGGTNNDWFYSVVVMNDNSIVAAGFSASTNHDLTGLNKGLEDAIIVKYDENGNLLWKKNYGGTKYEYFEKIIKTSDGGIIAAGGSDSIDGDLVGQANGAYDGIVVKYDVLGNVLWSKIIGGSGYDYIYSIDELGDGSFIISGETESIDGDFPAATNGNSDAFVMKLNSSGNVMWTKIFGGTEYEMFYSVEANTDGTIVAVGESQSNDINLSGLNKGDSDAVIVKYDANGNILWNKNYGGEEYDFFGNIEFLADGSIIVIGQSESENFDLTGLNRGTHDIILVEYDALGNVLWNKNYGGSLWDASIDLIKISDNSFMLVGYSYSNNRDLLGLNKGGQDAILLKFDSSGNFME